MFTKSDELLLNASRQRARAMLIALSTCAVALGTTLYLFPAGRYPFYPPCPIHLYTGLLCPGCGATRALSALFHGDLLAALRYNTLLVILLPALLFYGGSSLRPMWQGHTPPAIPKAALVGGFLVTAIFTVSRNLF